MIIIPLFLPMGDSGPFISGTKNVRERGILTAIIGFAGLIASGLTFYVAMFVDKVSSLYPKEPTTLLGSMLHTSGINEIIAMFALIIFTFAMVLLVAVSEKTAARLIGYVSVVILGLVIAASYIAV